MPRSHREPGKIIQNIDYASAAYNYPEEGAAEIIRFNQYSGNAIGIKTGVTYTVNGSPTFKYKGPMPGLTGFYGVQSVAQGDYFINTSAPTAWRPGTGNFTITIQFISDNAGSATQWVVDYNHNNTGTTAGWAFFMDATNLYFAACDGTNNHVSKWAHGGFVFKEGKLYTVHWLGRRSLNTVSLKINGVALTTTLHAGVNFSTLGSIAPSGGICFYDIENAPGSADNFRGTIFQVGYFNDKYLPTVPNFPPYGDY